MENAQASRSGICLRDRSAPPPVLTIHRSGFTTVSFFEQNRTTGRPKNHKEFGYTVTTRKPKVRGKKIKYNLGVLGRDVCWVTLTHVPSHAVDTVNKC